LPAGIPEGHQVEDRVERRVPASHHDDAPAGIASAVGVEDVRDPVPDAIGVRPLAGGRDAARAQRVRLRPSARGVDQRTRNYATLHATFVDDQLERGRVASSVLELVETAPRYRDDARPQPQRRRDGAD
jgi:hypothetical protein